MTVASRFVKLSHSFKLKVLECGHLILSKILTIIFNLARSLVKALLGCPPLSWAFEGWVGVVTIHSSPGEAFAGKGEEVLGYKADTEGIYT